MAGKMCDTINQNIEPYTGKLTSNYFKQFGTLLNVVNLNSSDRNDFSRLPIPQQPQAISNGDDTNISIGIYSDADSESIDYINPNLVWDRGKLSNQVSTSYEDDLVCLRRLESTVTNLECFLESLPNQETSLTSNRRSMSLICPSPPLDDTLSDVDLDKFDINKVPIRESISSAIDRAETTSLSDFHNVKDVLMKIKGRLDSYLRVSNNSSDSENANKANLEGNIAELKRELERYVQIINEKKENELRKFSENMINQSNIIQMKNAFSRKEKLQTNIYETLATKYAITESRSNSSDSTQFYPKERVHVKGGFTMRNCYDNDYMYSAFSDTSSVEYYTMLINEDKSENLLDDAPLPRYHHERDNISLIFRDPENIIKQWQHFQRKTINIKYKTPKSLKLKWKKRYKSKPHDIWGFTLDYHQNKTLQLKLEKERRLRFICRIFFYFFSIICFVLIVLIVQSLFTFEKSQTNF
ncbi:CLUMA_CG012948, isoform A [Clunio marinus]|uniref:CLUMA_CG012948, isoform A n=1 Tax=Clunio marinus TaxID=568069 RepID=A0A1J1IHB1_9DIPT|nr:CLUMA_CG012948, isoform A [Clunio marinus]